MYQRPSWWHSRHTLNSLLQVELLTQIICPRGGRGHMGECGRWNNEPPCPQRCPRPNPQSRQTCSLIWKRDFADVIKLRVLRRGDCPGLSRGAPSLEGSLYLYKTSHKDHGPYKGDVGESDEAEGRGLRMLCHWLCRWGKGPLEAGNSKEMGPFLECPEGTGPADAVAQGD